MDNGSILFLIMLGTLCLGVVFYLNTLFEESKLSIIESWLFKLLRLDRLKSKKLDIEIDESLGKAHCIVMDLAEALQNDDMTAQLKKTKLVYEQVRHYQKVATTSPITLPRKQEPPLLRAVK